MLDRKDFSDMKLDLERINEVSESLFRDSRDLVGLTKKMIFSLHRGNVKEAESFVDDLNKVKKKMQSTVKENSGLRHHNSFSVAMQEYVEATGYLKFIKEGRIPTRKQLGVETEEYLSGLCDLSGELVRKAVDLAIKGDVKTVASIKEFTEEFYGLLLELNPYGELRKKADQAPWNLNKLEDLVYEEKMRKR